MHTGACGKLNRDDNTILCCFKVGKQGELMARGQNTFIVGRSIETDAPGENGRQRTKAKIDSGQIGLQADTAGIPEAGAIGDQVAINGIDKQ